MLLIENLYLGMLGVFVAGILCAVLAKGSPQVANILSHGASAAGSVLAAVIAVSVLASGAQSFTFAGGLPLMGDLTVRIDALAAYFLLALGVVGAVASLYAMGYSRKFYARRYATLAALFSGFLASIALVLTISHVVYFLIAWETMAVVSFLLVNHSAEKPGVTSSAYKYMLMTSFGTVFIFVAFLLLATGAGSFDFSALHGAALSPALRNVVFLSAVIGFGTKAGLMPLHIWLPEAYPVAPSHVSAVMSGVMMKTAIYGLARFFLEFLGNGPAWWGWTILGLAIVSAVVGALYASQQQDLKRLVAYSSVENLGIILLGVGSGMLFLSYGHPALAGLAWAAALYHVMNHAIFKSLMFMGTGSVLYATDSRNMEELGGLIKRMPVTAPLFLIGAMAISALPPLNGFVSEWLTFQSLFALPQVAGGMLGRLVAVLLIAGLGLTGAVAAATFVKAFGITFLAKPRSPKASQAVEVPAVMNIAMGLLAAGTLVLGLFPKWMLGNIQGIVSGYGLDFGPVLKTEWYAIGFHAPESGALLSMPMLLAIIIVGLIAAVVVSYMNGKPRIETGEVWSCGQIPTAKTEYTGTGFLQPVKRTFGAILMPKESLTADTSAGSAYHGVKLKLTARIGYVVDEKFYHPFTEWIKRLAVKLKPLQSGSLQVYIGYIMVVTVILLIVGTR